MISILENTLWDDYYIPTLKNYVVGLIPPHNLLYADLYNLLIL